MSAHHTEVDVARIGRFCGGSLIVFAVGMLSTSSTFCTNVLR